MSLNLLPSQAKFQVEKIRAVALSRKILTFFLILWVVAVVIIFGAGVGVKWWLDKQTITYKSVVAAYLQSSSDIVTSQIIKFRTKLLGKVLTDRFEYSNAFNIVGKLFDPRIKIQDFELKERSFFVMSVVVDSSDLMNILESRVKEVNSGLEPQVTKIVIKTATYSKMTSNWIVAMEVYLK